MSLKESIVNFVEKRKDELVLSWELHDMVERVNNLGGDVQIRVNEEHLYEVDIVGKRLNIDDIWSTINILMVPEDQLEIIFKYENEEIVRAVSYPENKE